MMWMTGIAMVVIGLVMYSIGCWRGKRMRAEWRREDQKKADRWLAGPLGRSAYDCNVNPNPAPEGGPPVSQTRPLKLATPWAQQHCLCAECEGLRRKRSIANPARQSE